MVCHRGTVSHYVVEANRLLDYMTDVNVVDEMQFTSEMFVRVAGSTHTADVNAQRNDGYTTGCFPLSSR